MCAYKKVNGITVDTGANGWQGRSRDWLVDIKLWGRRMPKGTKVHKCVQKVMKKGHSKASAIRICQASTKQSYKTGRKSKKKK